MRQYKLLPLFLNIGKTHEFPIVIPSCNRIHFHQLKHKNSGARDRITSARVFIENTEVRFQRAGNSEEFFVNGVQGNSAEVQVADLSKPIAIRLEVECEDFSSCHCRQNRFQLNLSAVCG